MTPLHDSPYKLVPYVSTTLFLAMTSPLQEYSRQLANYTRRQWNTTSRPPKRDRVGEDNDTSVAHSGANEKRQESRATTASALQVCLATSVTCQTECRLITALPTIKDFDNTHDNRCE